jgi:prepilin-type N-terminal cleavage/methylation domain-containing protein/prepilin-type processing-associated H-X9-DG protein
MRSRSGFTLIEVLVVTAVLVLLGTMILPALAQAKARVHAVTCLNNLRQWGVATQLYAADHDDFLPPDGSPNPGPTATNIGWYIQLPAQVGVTRYHDLAWRTNATAPLDRSIWLCPANKRRSNGRNLFHYCLNEHVNGTGDEARPVRLGALEQPSGLVWLFDTKNLPAVGAWSFVPTNLHNAGAQFLFLDSHVARFRCPVYWDFERDKARTNHPSIMWWP